MQVTSLSHLLTTNARIALANPGATAIGKLSRESLVKQGLWPALEKKTAVFAGTVNDVANNLVVGAADAGIIWDAMLGQYPALAQMPAPELEGITGRIAVGVLSCSKQPTAALHFARYLAAPEQGLAEYAKQGYAIMAGDAWADRPELTLYAGALLKQAIEETITQFEEREGVKVNRVYNGCGILVGQIKAGKVPDAYFACDKQFLAPVRDLFPEPLVISTNRLVILVPKGNPHHIASLADLAQPGLRVGVGHEQQCALGQLTANTFRRLGVSNDVLANIKVRVPAGDMLVNELRAGALDAAVAYLANAVNANEFLDAVAIPNLPCSVAVQPYAVAKNARYGQLAVRLREALTTAESQERFAVYGFGWGEGPREQP